MTKAIRADPVSGRVVPVQIRLEEIQTPWIVRTIEIHLFLQEKMESHPIDVETPKRDSIEIREPLLFKWRAIARSNKRLHEAARGYYKNLADYSIVSAVALGSAGGLLNILLGVIDTELEPVINIGQVVLGATALLSAGIVSVSNQLAWPQKHQLHEEYTARYSEVVRMINSEETLSRLNDSSYASRGDFIRVVQTELDRIEDHAPPIPGFLEERLGLKSAHRNGD